MQSVPFKKTVQNGPVAILKPATVNFMSFCDPPNFIFFIPKGFGFRGGGTLKNSTVYCMLAQNTR